MVVGMQRFREHFRGFDKAFVLIGGAACDAWMSSRSLAFRKTKDLDIVLVTDALDLAFVRQLKAFVTAGEYEERNRQQTGKREFYRFANPKTADYPYMLELFSRAPVGLSLGAGQQIVPVSAENAVVSLSAILMDEGYYELVVATHYVADSVAMIGVDGLIPLKARAWMDLQARKNAGDQVDEDNIKKHRNDVFRLALTLPGGAGPDIAANIRQDLKGFLAAFPDGTDDWPAIANALQATTRSRTQPSLAEMRRTIATYFRLD